MTIKVGDKVRVKSDDYPNDIPRDSIATVTKVCEDGDVFAELGDSHALYFYRSEVEPITNPDYNDGNWHAWTGGECPVHPDSVVGYLTAGGYRHDRGRSASNLNFAPDCADPIVAFRVTKPYEEPKKPRELWMDDEGDTWLSRDGAIPYCKGEPALFREVL